MVKQKQPERKKQKTDEQIPPIFIGRDRDLSLPFSFDVVHPLWEYTEGKQAKMSEVKSPQREPNIFSDIDFTHLNMTFYLFDLSSAEPEKGKISWYNMFAYLIRIDPIRCIFHEPITPVEKLEFPLTLYCQCLVDGKPCLKSFSFVSRALLSKSGSTRLKRHLVKHGLDPNDLQIDKCMVLLSDDNQERLETLIEWKNKLKKENLEAKNNSSDTNNTKSNNDSIHS